MRLFVLALLLGSFVPVARTRASQVDAADSSITPSGELLLHGRAPAARGSYVTVSLAGDAYSTAIAPDGAWTLLWPKPLAPGRHLARVAVTTPAGEDADAARVLDVRVPGRLPRRPLAPDTTAPSEPEAPANADFQVQTDRWRMALPDSVMGPLHEPGSLLDPYHQNRLKGDFPILGDRIFLSLAGVSDTRFDVQNAPAEGSASQVRQRLALGFDLFRGDTSFRPFDWRVRSTAVVDIQRLRAEPSSVLEPAIGERTDTDTEAGLQELFFEARLADLSVNYDVLSLRAGIQGWSSDFRGWVFDDADLGARLYGNLHSNRYQYNLAFFERLEKDPASGLNRLDLRDQRLAVGNLYRQNLLAQGYTSLFSVHYLEDRGAGSHSGAFGTPTARAIDASYLGYAGFGHVGRLNVDHAVYYVTGEDSANPFAGRPVDIRAWFLASEWSFDRDWLRPRLGLLYASGDSSPGDAQAQGFDAISSRAALSDGVFGYWHRVGLLLPAGAGVLVNRESLLPNLRENRYASPPNYVNPGLLLASLGLDLELMPTLKTFAGLGYLRFDETEVLEAILENNVQRPGMAENIAGEIAEEIGVELNLGCRWRPLLHNHVVVLGGVSAFAPGRGFRDLYDDDSLQFSLFGNLVLAY